MARRRRDRRDKIEMRCLLNDDEEHYDANFQHTEHRVPSTMEDNQENPSTTHEIQYGTFTQAAGHSTDSTENMRFIVLGSDNSLMNKVCALILGESQSNSRCRPAICELREGHIHGRHVSIVTTPINWLERLKSFWFFKNAVKSLKNEMEFCESLVFPGPHAFLLVIDEMSSKEIFLLDAIKEAFGQEALDYSMVLFLSESHHNQKKNSCVKACSNRYHILTSTNQSVANLFVKVEEMIQNKKSKCFINNFEFFKKVSAHLHREYQIEYDEKQSELVRKLRKMSKTIRELETEVELKDAMLQEERQKCKTLEQKLTKVGVEQDLLTRVQPRTAQRAEGDGEVKIESREKASQASGSQIFVRVRRGSKEIDPPNLPEHKDEREIESRKEESQAIGSQTFVRVRRSSKEIDPPNMSENKYERGENETRVEDSQICGSQTFEGLKTLRRGSKEIDPPNTSKSDHGHLFVL